MLNEIIEQLKQDEGFRGRPYRDSRDFLTIGYGRNLDAGELSEREASFMLANDVDSAMEALKRYLPWTASLDDARYGVLLNMTFNMGIQTLLTFHRTLAAIQAGNYEAAANDMNASLWAKQVGARAQRLMTQMKTGVWQYATPQGEK